MLGNVRETTVLRLAHLQTGSPQKYSRAERKNFVSITGGKFEAQLLIRTSRGDAVPWEPATGAWNYGAAGVTAGQRHGRF